MLIWSNQKNSFSFFLLSELFIIEQKIVWICQFRKFGSLYRNSIHNSEFFAQMQDKNYFLTLNFISWFHSISNSDSCVTMQSYFQTEKWWLKKKWKKKMKTSEKKKIIKTFGEIERIETKGDHKINNNVSIFFFFASKKINS